MKPTRERSTTRKEPGKRAARVLLIVVAGILVWLAVALISRTILSATSAKQEFQGGMTGSVERGLLASARREGKVAAFRCRETTRDSWKCRTRFVNGEIVIQQAVWYAAHQSLGISVLERSPPPRYARPLG